MNHDDNDCESYVASFNFIKYDYYFNFLFSIDFNLIAVGTHYL